MPSQKNINQVKEIQDKLNQAKSVVLADYRGLSVEKISDLRNRVKAVGGELKVNKNRLIKLAFTAANLTLETDEVLTGPTAILYAFADEIAPIKALYEFFKENDLPKIKVGFLAKEFLAEDRVINLAQLPSREQLQTQLVVILNSPIAGLVYALKGNLNKLVGVLKALQEKKGGE